ncbi:MAG: hypothetical protein H6631_20595 [Anaerolineaceae bacterium]|nr:hypothetical protein [Anaerolineaceae bacterium]
MDKKSPTRAAGAGAEITEWGETTRHNYTTLHPTLQQLDDIDIERLMAIAVRTADAEPGRRAQHLRIWSSLKNAQRCREGLPPLAGLPEAGLDEVEIFLREIGQDS